MTSRLALTLLPPLANTTEPETRLVVQDSSVFQYITVEQAY
jgi:hypothetical protein